MGVYLHVKGIFQVSRRCIDAVRKEWRLLILIMPSNNLLVVSHLVDIDSFEVKINQPRIYRDFEMLESAVNDDISMTITMRIGLCV